MSQILELPVETYEALQSEEIYMYGRPSPGTWPIKPLVGFPVLSAFWRCDDNVRITHFQLTSLSGEVFREIPFRDYLVVAPGDGLRIDYEARVTFE
jgi:hypothetical protein